MNNIKLYTTTKDAQWVEAEVHTAVNPVSLTRVAPAREVTWEGFGGCFNELSKVELDRLSDEKKNSIYDDLFSPTADGLRLKFCRLPIGASDYAVDWYSLNENSGDYKMDKFSLERDQKYLIPYIKEAIKRNPDMKLFASPWSPPTWMKQPPVYNFGRLIWEDENLKAYALYLLKFIQEYRKEGVEIHQLHVQNEVTSDQKFPSCLWSGEQLKEFIGKYLGPLWKNSDMDAQIWLGTINATGWNECPGSSRFNLYANCVMDDAEAASYISGIAYQWEGKYAIQTTVDSYPELQYIQSENECGDGRNTWEYSKYVFELMRHYIRNGVCGYVYWNMILKTGGSSTWGWTQNSMITVNDQEEVHYEYEYYIMKHVSRFLESGAKVLKLTGHFSGTSIGFENPDGTIVLIIQNPFLYEKGISFEGHVFNLKADSINTVIIKNKN